MRRVDCGRDAHFVGSVVRPESAHAAADRAATLVQLRRCARDLDAYGAAVAGGLDGAHAASPGLTSPVRTASSFGPAATSRCTLYISPSVITAAPDATNPRVP